jgi:hypothetical protein
MDSHQSNVNFTDLPEDIWLEIIKVCEPKLLYSMYLVNKLFQQIIEDMNLLPPRLICSAKNLTMCKKSWENLENSTKDFLSHHKFLQETKHYELKFLTHEDLFLNSFNKTLSSMINMLEIDTNINGSGSNYQSILESVFYLPNITVLSLAHLTTIPENISMICSKNSLRYLKLRDGILYSFMDFSTCSFVNFSLDNMYCKNGTSIKMPHCLKKCDLSCYLSHHMKVVGPDSNIFVQFQMSHCKELKTL